MPTTGPINDHINDLPTEILALVISYLWEELVPPYSDAFCHNRPVPDASSRNLRRVRLVCRYWELVTRPVLFGDARLIPDERGLAIWTEMLSCERVCSVVRHVAILLPEAPEAINWEEKTFPRQLHAAISHINHLPLVSSIFVGFPMLGSTGPEARHDILRAVFEMMTQRSRRQGHTKSIITDLSVPQLSAIPGWDRAESDVFREATSSVQELHLGVRLGDETSGDDPALILHNWLVPPAAQLVTLTLSFYYCEVDFALRGDLHVYPSLIFPRLRTLRLCEYPVAGDTALDWVARQCPSLRVLRMHDCFIVSHVALTMKWDRGSSSYVPPPQKRAGDSRRLHDGAFGLLGSGYGGGRIFGVYEYRTTWADLLARIRDEVPSLRDFDASWSLRGTLPRRGAPWRVRSRPWRRGPGQLSPEAREVSTASLRGGRGWRRAGTRRAPPVFCARYVAIDESDPLPWKWPKTHENQPLLKYSSANKPLGAVEFGNGNRECRSPGEREVGCINRHEETLEEDLEAWNELFEDLRTRDRAS